MILKSTASGDNSAAVPSLAFSSCQIGSCSASTRRGMWWTSASRLVAQCDQLRLTITYGLAQARDELVAILDLTSQEDPILASNE